MSRQRAGLQQNWGLLSAAPGLTTFHCPPSQPEDLMNMQHCNLLCVAHPQRGSSRWLRPVWDWGQWLPVVGCSGQW